MEFHTRIRGIPAICRVTYASDYRPMAITGTGYGDADPPEPEEFEFTILDRRGRPAPWLERKLTEADSDRLLAEYLERQHEPY